ncbi:hypothetical protein [Paraburkholderia aromaticivorans]|uniref:hypothetical protein n=1 Tax=Paraburkholderia aromaticivorans TaxID=2026199 RepID=UPI001455E5EB|nr:hypothetical protein [Paraburkholderia aromaticivorans]
MSELIAQVISLAAYRIERQQRLEQLFAATPGGDRLDGIRNNQKSTSALVQAMSFDYPEELWLAADGYRWMGSDDAQHAQGRAFYEAFGLDYDRYAAFVSEDAFVSSFNALYDEAALHVLIYLDNPAAFEIASANRADAYREWARAVANEDLGAARERADAGMAELLKGPATAPSKHATELLGRAARVRMHGVTRPTSPRYLISNVLKWRHTHFVVDRFGAVYIPDAETHAQFVSYLQLFGYEYAEVSHNKPMVQDLSTILLQEFAKAFYACAFTMEAFAYNFPEASRDLERYVKALLSNRRSTVRKLHSKVWPEIVAWAKTQPAREAGSMR